MRLWSSHLLVGLSLAATFTMFPRAAQAQLTGFVNNPTTNSTDFSSFVAGLGNTLNTNVNFDAHPTGTLQPNFYAGSNGVTITGVAGADNVVNGVGPSDDNTTATPISAGEGVHPSSNYLNIDRFGPVGQIVTFSFTNRISAFGLFTIDLFDPTSFSGAGSALTLSAYSGQNGTGTLLGSVTSPRFNFQRNRQFFMGIAVTNGTDLIGSLTLSRPNDSFGDTVGLDNIRFARTVAVTLPTTAPEPGSLDLLLPLVGAGSLVLRRRKK